VIGQSFLDMLMSFATVQVISIHLQLNHFKAVNTKRSLHNRFIEPR
jgi:hypothetical protein